MPNDEEDFDLQAGSGGMTPLEVVQRYPESALQAIRDAHNNALEHAATLIEGTKAIDGISTIIVGREFAKRLRALKR